MGEPDAHGWMPIESAPTDGTEFLAYDPVAKKYDVCTAEILPPYYRVRFSVNVTQCDGTYGPSRDDFHDTRATRWQPLPKPPVPGGPAQ